MRKLFFLSERRNLLCNSSVVLMNSITLVIVCDMFSLNLSKNGQQ